MNGFVKTKTERMSRNGQFRITSTVKRYGSKEEDLTKDPPKREGTQNVNYV